MCKKLIVLVFAAAVLFSGAAIAEVDDSGRLIVPETSVAPIIDGELDDLWQSASEESLLIVDIINATSAVPEDVSDLSGRFKVMYDDDNLYFFIEVQDSVLDYQFSDWQGDSVEIFFDGDNSKGSTYDGVNDNQIRINSDDVELGDIGSSLPVDGTVFMVLLTDVGYNIEAAFPLAVLQIAPENVFGFEVQLNDNDGGGGRETLIRWFSNDNNSWQDASLFGEAILVPEIEPVDPGDEGLVAYYAFENNADDGSGSGLAGTMVGDPVFVEGLADYGMALDFDGIDDVVELGKFDVIGQITLAAWIRADDFEINDARVISKANEWGGNDHWWMLSTISETSLRFRLKTDDGQDTATLISDPVLWAGVWAHVAVTWDGGMMRIYKDGVEVASQEKGGTAVAVDPDISVAIGSQPSDAFATDPVRVVKFFDGLIDEAHIYERALSDGELLYLAGERATPVDPGANGLVASYALDNDASDSSGNGHNGTVEGAPMFVAPGWDGTGACMQFGGDEDRITVDSFDVMGTGITLAAWINPTVLQDDARMVSKSQGSGTADHYWAMILSGSGEDNLEFRLRTDIGSTTRRTAPEGTDVPDNEWTHVAVTWDAGDPVMRFYKNGEEIDSIDKEGTAVATAEGVQIGIGNQSATVPGDGGIRPFGGLIDDVGIYQRALSVAEIRYLAGFRVNLLQNPSFEEDEPILDDPDWLQWCTWNPAEGAGSNVTIVDTDAVDGARSLKVEPIGPENWHFILVNISFAADLDKNYTATFWAKAEAPRPLTVQMKASDNSVNAWNATGFDLTTDWAEYSYTSEVLHTDVKLEFLCAESEVPFLLDSVSVSEGK